MRVCNEHTSETVFGRGAVASTGFFAPPGSDPWNISYSVPTPAPAPASPSWFDSGVTNGVRDDGKQLGYGCGTATTDHLVPDVVFTYNLTPACVAHDTNYETCGVTKAQADAQLGNDVSAIMGGGLLGVAVGGLYEAGVTIGGQSAYSSAQASSGCNTSGGGYSDGVGSAYGGNRQGL